MANGNWPGKAIAAELREANSRVLREAHEAFLRGRESWPNQQSERLEEERTEAETVGVKPCTFGEPEFERILAGGIRFNWAIRLDGSFWISPSVVVSADGPVRISHALLAGNGGAVLAAGEGRAGAYLSNTTGHYKNGEYVIEPVKSGLAAMGIFFQK